VKSKQEVVYIAFYRVNRETRVA